MPRRIRQFAIVLCVILAVWYLAYRALFTLNLAGPYAIFASLVLYLSEAYGCTLMFVYFFQIWDTTEPAPVPIIEGRSVDVYIPTYNEDVHMLRGTIEAAKAMDYPHRTYVLDDGRRPHVKALCEELGVDYIIRDNNLHAKAGNMNHALDVTDGEFIIVFDADHIAKRNFITRLIGYFADDKLAFIQTPHFYYNFENYQASVDYRKQFYWEEGQLFYNIVQPGKNYWNAVSFCGSAAMFRRSSLVDIGMLATETITEDMHTGLRLHAAGYKSLFVNERLILGQAAPDPIIFGPQRLRWGEGNLSVMAYDNPFTMKGLTFAQRICYAGSMLCWTTGIAKFMLYLTPVMMLFTGVPPLQDFYWTYAAITISYLLATWGAVKITGNGYGNLWEIELAAMGCFWSQMQATYRAVMKRKSSTFVVTNKRGGAKSKKTAYSFIWPHISLVFINCLAVVWALLRLLWGLSTDWFGFTLGLTLVGLHTALAISVIRRSLKPKDGRFSSRHPADTIHVAYERLAEDGTVVGRGQAITQDINECGVGLMAYEQLKSGEKLRLVLRAGEHEVAADGEVRMVREVVNNVFAKEGKAAAFRCGVQFQNLTSDQIRRLWNLSIFYACERSYQRFEKHVQAMRSSLWRALFPPIWPKREELPVHLPISATIGDAEQPEGEFATVSERLDSIGVEFLVAKKLEVGKSIDFRMPSAFGLLEGNATISKVVEDKVGLSTLYRVTANWGRFVGTGRGRLLSVLGTADTKSMAPVLRHTPKTLPEPIMEPVAATVLPVLVAAVMMMAIFYWSHYDWILMTRITRGALLSVEEVQRVDQILANTLEQKSLVSAGRVVLLRQSLLSMGRVEDASRLGEILVHLAPNDVYARAAWADHLANEGKHHEAEEQLKLVLKEVDSNRIDPRVREQILLSAARISVALKDYPNAISRFKKYIDLVPTDQKIRKEFAGVLASAHETGEALDLLLATPLDLEGEYLLANVYTARNEFAEAQKVCEKIVKEYPQEDKALLMLADLATWQKHYPEAIFYFDELLVRQPGSRELEIKLARVYLWSGNFDEALARLSPFVRDGTTDSSLEIDFIAAAANSSQITSAQLSTLVACAHRASARAHDDPKPLLELAEAFIRHQEATRAIPLLEEAVEKHPDDMKIRLRLADVLHDLQEFAKADKHYQVLLIHAKLHGEEVPLPAARGVRTVDIRGRDKTQLQQPFDGTSTVPTSRTMRRLP